MREAPYTSVATFLDHWDGVRLVTRKLLHGFSDRNLAYRLVPQWRSVGELFHHIGAHQFFVARGTLLQRWVPAPDEPDADWKAHKEAVAGSVATLDPWLREVQERVHAWAGRARRDALERVRHDNPWHEGMRGWLLLHHAYQDELHHRGQLYAIARLLGKDPPSAFAEEYPEYWDPRKEG